MPQADEQDIATINGLITRTVDSAEAYREASRDEETGRHRDAFIRMAKERDEIVGDLQTTVRQLGGVPRDSGSILGGVHRTFAFFSAIITKGDVALKRRIESGEDSLRDSYAGALDARLGAIARQAISQANMSIVRGHGVMNDLEHAADA